jgi:hypothetical protein
MRMRHALALVLFGVLLAGCSSADHGPTVRKRQMTDADTPFGGGFPPNQRPDGDPFNAASRRDVVELDWRADNGAPETRLNTGGDTRIDTRTQNGLPPAQKAPAR